MTKEVMNYTDELFEDALETEGAKGYGKAFMSGFIEGAVDGMVVLGGIWTVSNIVTIVSKGKINPMKWMINR